ncbi:acetate--CoA ligase family protein [Promethearchaeum syntrophicum]|uniref:Acetate--CoA ligase family protein n=1 Tax=Promethearchaeum syntrophicum TaxID=2594042 RepID=A0A5B9DD57_9ARCH|nr:CoA-binding protein [Candidatus Prometheoarchaeum syntrophicum]QEE16700.1 succinyl-CoA synthetase subunit alpha [Candidatus Prometheoarchaeum syntrophicum]
MKRFFYPQTIAVIGATDDPKKFGNAVTSNLLSNKQLKAQVFPISRNNPTVSGLKAYKSVTDVPVELDLAIILVPAQVVPTIVDQCIEKKVARIIIVTAGFGEINNEGKKIEQQMLEKSKSAGTRIIGPNCVGIQNIDIEMNASFIQSPIPGNISMVSQSGSFGCAVIDGMKWQNCGLSKFANIGNAIDVSFDDIINYFKEDENSKVIAVYLESVKNGKAFFNSLKEISPKKPVVVLKGGRTSAGMAAAGSHTGSIASNYTILKTAVEQAGATMCTTIEEYIIALKTFSYLSLPRGNKIGVLTNSGGTGVLFSDKAEELDLKLSEFSDHLKDKLKPHLFNLVQIVNPLDMIAGAREKEYYEITKAMLEEDSGIDIVVACGVYPPFLGMKFENNYRGIIRAWNDTGRKKPIIPLLVFGNGYDAIIEFARQENVPYFSSPSEAAYAVKILIQRMEYMSKNK